MAQSCGQTRLFSSGFPSRLRRPLGSDNKLLGLLSGIRNWLTPAKGDAKRPMKSATRSTMVFHFMIAGNGFEPLT
jgi:hypothetical protein